MISKLFKLFDNLDCSSFISLIVIVFTIYVTQYYYKYFTRINPLPGPLPFPLVGNLPQLIIRHGGNLKKFFESNHKNYGDLFEFQFEKRIIALNRTEYIEKLLSASTKDPHIMKISNSNNKGYHELGIIGKG